jgi:hypothetical protein
MRTKIKILGNSKVSGFENIILYNYNIRYVLIINLVKNVYTDRPIIQRSYVLAASLNNDITARVIDVGGFYGGYEGDVINARSMYIYIYVRIQHYGPMVDRWSPFFSTN